jgi:putative ABC transport system ATP-binding protein
MPLIQANQVTKSFGTGDVRVDVLRGIDLQIDAGEFVAVMGPSGSGKSTFLSILGGIESPTSGKVLLEGTDLASLSDDARTRMRRRRIGFIFQAFNLISTLTAVENVCLPLELDGVDRRAARDRAMQALELVEMTARSKHIPSKMSGGEQQRVAIARALAIKPAIILADEPTGNLDSRQGTRVTNLLRDLVKQHNQTIVMVTHDAGVAESASRLVKLRDGAIESDESQPGWLEVAGVAV